MAIDKIKIGSPVSNSIIHAIIKPASDGDFIFEVSVQSEGNNQDHPEMWASLTDESTKEETLSPRMGWGDGDSGLVTLLTENRTLKKDTVYNFTAQGHNKNAKATHIALSIERL